MGSNNFWVDPEGVERQGTPYHRAAADFRNLSTRIDEILARYPNAFGGDELGQKFRGPFMQGIDGIKGRINLVAGRLEYTGDGLVTTGREFRRAEDDATDVSRQLRNGIEGRRDAPPVFLKSGRREQGELLPALEPMHPLLPREHTPAIPGIPAERGYLTSSFTMRAQWGSGPLSIDGVPVDDGFHLLGANEVADGVVRMTVDGYEAIVPLPAGRTVLVGGEPVTVPEGTQLFLVKDGPQRDDPLPADERTYVEFGRDGSALRYQPSES
jgi:hypothetical protein